MQTEQNDMFARCECCSSHCPGPSLTGRSCATVCSPLLRSLSPSSFVYIWCLYAPLLSCFVCIQRSQQYTTICIPAKPTFPLLCAMVSAQSNISELILIADIFVCLNLSTSSTVYSFMVPLQKLLDITWDQDCSQDFSNTIMVMSQSPCHTHPHPHPFNYIFCKYLIK